MKKIIFGIIMLFSWIFAYGQCSQTDIQQAYVTVSLNDNMTVHAAVYSLSDTTKVNFAVGNLMYKPKTGTWKLADHQYDFVGGYKRDKFDKEDLDQWKNYGTVWDTVGGKYVRCQNTGGNSKPVEDPNYDGWIDLFPQEAAKNVHFVDTLHNFIYRTPKHVEFQYLVGGFKIGGYTIGRKDYEKLRARGRIIVNDSTFVNGLILLPDMPDSCSSVENCILKIMPVGTKFKSDYDGCMYFTDNIFTAAQWDVLEKQGAVFLPAGGGISWKSGTTYDYGIKYNRSGFYWTYNTSKSLEFGGYYYNGQNCTPSFVDNCNENNRRSIRVVREERQVSTAVTTQPKSCTDYKWGTGLIEVTGGKIKIDSINECTYGLKAVPKNGYKFACLKDLGSISFKDSVTLEIDTTIQNYVYEATFVRDNAHIYKWLDDSIIIRTDTTDLLSDCNNPGWAYTIVGDWNRMTEEDEHITKLDWGIWKADVTELINNNEYAGQHLHMIIHNSCGTPSAVIDTIIPVVVHGTMDAHDIDFHSDVPHCDLQVLEDAILYVDSDIVVNGTLDIHEGGKVIINEGHTLEAQNIILRGDGIRKKWGQLLINGAAYGPNKNDSVWMYYDYILTLNYWQPLSLPDTISPNDITSSISRQPAIFRNMFYNTLTRNTGASGWEVHNDDSLIMGHGYITTAQPNRWNGLYQKTDILKYPIRIKLSNEQTDRQISVYGSTDPNIKVNDKNWNLIGNPYLSDYIVDDIGVIKMGDAYGGHTEVRYITYTTDNFMTYVQRPLIGDTLKSFNVYFIQTIDNGDIIFKKKNLAHNPAPAHKHIKNEHQFGITLSQNGTVEHIGLLYGDFSTDYEINADLSKMFGFGNQMSAYSLLNNDPLAFQALPLENITNAVPLGYRNANISNMTFKYDFERYSDSELNAVWLFDIVNNSYTDLLTNAYTFTPNATNEDNRFYISFELKSNVTTSVDNVTFDFEDMHFDILGRRTYLLENGVYIIKNKNGKYIKVIR